MKRLFLPVCLLWLAVVSYGQARIPVVLISVDGLKPDYIIEADKHHLKIPNLRRLLARGAYANAVTGVLPTVTYPSHTTMLTGVSPSGHGILYNTPFDPFGRNLGGWMWYAEDIKVPTLWEAVGRAGFVTSSVDWPVSVGAPVDFNIAQYWRATNEDDHKLLRALSTPGLLEEGEKSLGRYPAGYIYTVEADTRRAEFNAWLIEAKRPRFHTGYFSVLDEIQHAYGPYTPEAYATIEAIDGMIGKVWQAAEKAGHGRAIFCVVSDHGFAPSTNALSLNAAFRRDGLISLDDKGKIKECKAISWGGGGSTAIMIQEPADSTTRDRVSTVIRELQADPRNGIYKVIDNAEARRMGGYPDAAFVVFMKPGYSVNGNLETVLATGMKQSGTHGLLRDLPEMDSSFFIAGPGIPKGKVFQRIDMRDIAPTLAGLLRVALPAAEGRNLFGTSRIQR